MSDWYYAADNQQKGPINESELKTQLASGKLPDDTLVWKEGMDAWTPASQVAAFTFRAAPEAAAVQPGAPTSMAFTKANPDVNNPDSTKPLDMKTIMGKPEALEVSQEDVENNKIFGILAYLGPLCFIPLITSKDSPFAMYHANQGIVLFILEVVISIVLAVVDEIIYSILPAAGVLTSILLVVHLVPLAGMIWGIVHAAAGKCVPLPYIGGIKLIKAGNGPTT